MRVFTKTILFSNLAAAFDINVNCGNTCADLVANSNRCFNRLDYACLCEKYSHLKDCFINQCQLGAPALISEYDKLCIRRD